MLEKEIEFMFIEHLEGRVHLCIDIMPGERYTSHEVGVMTRNNNYVSFHLDTKNNMILYESQFAYKDDHLMDVNLIKAIKEEFKNEDSPFHFVTTCDEHNGLNLCGLIDKDQITPVFLDRVVDYLSDPSPFLKKLMMIPNESNN